MPFDAENLIGLGQEHRLIAPFMRRLLPLYRMAFAGLIRRGWMQQ
jgi:hypothetical protein